MIKKDEIPADEHTTGEHKSAARFLNPDKLGPIIRKHSFRQEPSHEGLSDEDHDYDDFDKNELDARFCLQPNIPSIDVDSRRFFVRGSSQDLEFPDEIASSHNSDNHSEQANDSAYHWYLEMFNSPEFQKGNAALIVVGLIAVAMGTWIPGVLGTVVLAFGITGVGVGAVGLAGSLNGFFKPSGSTRHENNETHIASPASS